MSKRQIWILLVAFLIYIVTAAVTNLGIAEKTSLGHQLDGWDDCLGQCKRSTSKLRASQDVSGCYTQCLERKRKKREIDEATIIYKNCNVPSTLRQQEIGKITNISVEFTKRQENGTTIAYFANLTWDVEYFNSSLYNADVWQGFDIRWMTGKSNKNFVLQNCAFNNKNRTWIGLVMDLNDPDPFPLYVMIVLYPPRKEDMNVQRMPHFFPEGWFTSVRSSTSTSTSKTTTNLPTITTFIDPQRNQPTEKPKDIHYVVVVVIVGVSLGVVLVIVAFRYLYRRSKKPNTFTPDPPDTEYDTSIIYSSEDGNFVIKKLIPFLEKENSFKCYVHFRNWEVGKTLDDNMVYTIYKCRKVIAVISKHFIESDFCQRELSMALERLARLGDSSLIVINLDLPFKDVPEALRDRSYIDLTSSTEKKTWPTRLLRQISAEDNSGINSSKLGSEAVRSEITEMDSWGARFARQMSKEDLGYTSLNSGNKNVSNETTEDGTEIRSLRNTNARQHSNTVVIAELKSRSAYSQINDGRDSSCSESSIGSPV